MKVWTIQPWSVWLQLKKNGVYYANENLSQLLHPRDHLLEDEFTKAYRWMAEQMQEKISLPPKNVTVPICAGMLKISMLYLIIDIIQIKLVSS